MVSERKRDQKGVYREFQGIRYNYWEKRGLYVSQRGGKQSMLHRVLWESINGGIPKGCAVVPLNGDWECFEVENWECRPRAKNGKPFEPVHPCIEFEGKRYYKAIGRKYYYHTYAYGDTTRKTLLHRDIWEKYNGPIPEGYEIHHKDFDASNNDSTNLEALSTKAHRALHAERKRKRI